MPDPFDRLPPHSIEAEMCLLGALAIAGNDRASFASVAAMIDRTAFYLVEHQIIFDAITALHRDHRPVDAVLLHEALIARGVLEEIGGVEYLKRLLNSVPSTAHARHYAGIVREKALRRRIIATANEALAAAYAPSDEDDAAELAMGLASKAAQIAATGKADSVHQLEPVVYEVLDAKEQKADARIPTGLSALDQAIGGLRIGGKTIVGAKPGMGKSQLIKQIARNIAGAGTRVGIITIEESRHKIGENLLANESGIPNNRIAFNQLADGDWQRLYNAAAMIAGLPIYIVDSARKLSSIIAAAHLLACEHQCKVIAVDHLHIIDGEADVRTNREREVSKISAELKWAWKGLGVAGIEAAQLNRAGGKDRPTLASLRDSGSLEQDGDVIILLHREDYYHGDDQDYEPTNVLEAHIAKNKDGPTATVSLRFDAARQRVSDFAF